MVQFLILIYSIDFIEILNHRKIIERTQQNAGGYVKAKYFTPGEEIVGQWR
jgi:hypothetical protein